MDERLREMIAGVAAGAAEGAAALRRCGVALVLDAYSVEARLGVEEPVTSVRLDFVIAGPGSPTPAES